MRPLVVALLLLAACGERNAVTLAAPAPAPRLEAVPLAEGERISIDGATDDAVWNRANEVVVPLEGEGAPEVRIKAAYDEERFYLLVQWADPTKSLNRYWKYVDLAEWERHAGQDSFSICWSPGALAREFRAQGCALFCHGDRHVYDAERGYADYWFWGAQTTSYYGQALDMWLPFGENQRLRGDRQPRDSGNMPNVSTEFEGPGAARKFVRPGDSRFLTHDNAQNLTLNHLRNKLSLEKNLGWEVPLDLLRPFKGSRGDIAAKGRHNGKAWVLELSRRLKTGNTDDQPLGDPLIPFLFAVAVHDGTEKGAHFVSGSVELRFVTIR